MDACYRSIRSKHWEPVGLEVSRGTETAEAQSAETGTGEGLILIKEEKMPDGRTKLILKDRESGKIIQKLRD